MASKLTFVLQRQKLASVLLAILCITRIANAFQITRSNNNGQRLTGLTNQAGFSSRGRLSSRLYADLMTKPKKKNLKTFQRYLEIECWKQPELRELEPVLKAVAESCKQINRIVQRAQTDDLYGVALGKDGKPLEDNVQGEVPQQLDVLCNTIMLRAFCGSSSSICAVASEEEDEIRSCSDVMVR
jgi:fructose-1,6-bisphosphatase I